ncbi:MULTISPECIES: TetR/AcrR family transcriptional regulator [unclassified Cryobacterium]|uniref:TetR/AcrR family transcriptional regulator n=1 Tax=unclassified Cryobacterium TaxID=2649013 RepID=UPI001447E0FE|nr:MULTISPECIES: TetR/AcrR family transcriptional regulator [unclassified Cryobacterium]
MPQPVNGRYAKGVAKREAILDAALEVFGEVGLHGASLREIAKRVGVSHQSLMHYFPTKNELLMAVLRRRDERLRRHFDDPSGMSLRELISLAEDNRRMPGVIELYNMASAEATTEGHPAHAYYREFYERIVESTGRFLQRAADRGVLKEGWTPELAARAVLGAQDGLQLQWLYDRNDVKVAQIMRMLVAALITVPLEELEETPADPGEEPVKKSVENTTS